MFGLLRTVLALMVVVQHFLLPHSFFGVYAVFGFFVISGYLMTRVMHETYRFNAPGRVAFICNRFLRLFPLYWVSALLCAAAIHVFGEEITKTTHPMMVWPLGTFQWFQNISLIYFSWNPADVAPKLSPVTWALTVELTYYSAICLGVSKTLPRAVLWLSVSLLYVFWSLHTHQPWRERYLTLAAGSLPFALGAVVYFISKNDLKMNPTKLARWTFSILLANAVAWALYGAGKWPEFYQAGFYVNLLLCGLLVFSLARGGSITSILSRTDKLVGDFSYPIYLFHWPVWIFVSMATVGTVVAEPNIKSATVFGIALVAVLVMSYLTIVTLDRPIELIRGSIRGPLNQSSVGASERH